MSDRVKGVDLNNSNKSKRFERSVLPHLDAAFNLARWLMHNTADAEDAVQEAYLRAFRHFDGFRGEDGRAWLLAIVRNACYTLLQNKWGQILETFDEVTYARNQPETAFADARTGSDPETLLLQNADQNLIDLAIRELPTEFREVLVLRELEDFSYKEIAGIAGIPIGTVMSRLARARGLLRQSLSKDFPSESNP